MRSGREIRALTGLRGLAALHVMIFHYYIPIPFSNPVSTFLAHGYLQVDLFFVLSGFVMALTYSRMFEPGWTSSAFTKFMGRRFARIYPLYFVTTVCAFLLISAGLLEESGPHIATLKSSLMLNLAMIQSWGFAESLNVPAWSISAELAAYLVFPVLAALALFRRPVLAWLLGASSIAVIAVLCMIPTSVGHQSSAIALLDFHDPRLALPLLRCLPEFCLGLLAFRIAGLPLGRKLSEARWIAPTVSVALVALMAMPRADFAIVMMFPLLILSLVSEQSVPARILGSTAIEFLGQLSYSIYLVHALMWGMITPVHEYVARRGLHHGQSYAVVAATLLTFVCCYFAYRFIEVPGRRWLRQVFEGGRLAPIAVEPAAP
jgi:peptidoglycan/LPS O-acetylase OafA/YrhL